MAKVKTSVYLDQYQPSFFTITQTILEFHLDADKTFVHALYHVKLGGAVKKDLVLDGVDLDLIEVTVDAEVLSQDLYSVNEDFLTIFGLDKDVIVGIKVNICPRKNTFLSGLYKSGDNLCTQCESQGFRRIVYSLDRPDVLSSYQVTLVADPKVYPILLSNGDQVSRVEREDGNIQVTFVDPAPKPSYLFALVAGDFGCVNREYVSSKGRKHNLFVYLPRQYPIEEADFALYSLEKAMRWDEDTFDLHYDLDSYYIVAMPDFNFGAMENKGLNIFNTSALLASKDVATDASYLRVLTVVGHEYFHNWTGNRVTLRDWFQLSLKEGLTTYREMKFGCSVYGDLARLGYIMDLVERQFPEDAGPTAHPILTKSYINIDNFYTATTYTKGAEVLRMLEDLLGFEVIVKILCQYLEKFDGSAATIEDFLEVVSSHSSLDMDKFKLWYMQEGTPNVKIETYYDSSKKSLKIDLEQFQSGSRSDSYQSVLMPVVCKIFDRDGNILDFVADGDLCRRNSDDSFVLIFSDKKQSFVLNKVEVDPVLSCFRGLSAPVKHSQNLTMEQRSLQIAYDHDVYVKYIQSMDIWHMCLTKGRGLSGISSVLEGFDKLLSKGLDVAHLITLAFRIPSLRYCQETLGGYDFDELCRLRKELLVEIAKKWENVFLSLYEQASANLQGEYKWKGDLVNYRSLRSMCLEFLLRADVEKYAILAKDLYFKSDNVTDKLASLNAVVAQECEYADDMLADFYVKGCMHDLQLNRWFMLSASRCSDDPLANIKSLLVHSDCDKSSPNRVCSCYGGWISGNFESLHDVSGLGYKLCADLVLELDKINPSTASRIVASLLNWRCYDDARQLKIKSELKRMLDKGVSSIVFEKISLSLKDV